MTTVLLHHLAGIKHEHQAMQSVGPLLQPRRALIQRVGQHSHAHLPPRLTSDTQRGHPMQASHARRLCNTLCPAAAAWHRQHPAAPAACARLRRAPPSVPPASRVLARCRTLQQRLLANLLTANNANERGHVCFAHRGCKMKGVRAARPHFRGCLFTLQCHARGQAHFERTFPVRRPCQASRLARAVTGSFRCDCVPYRMRARGLIPCVVPRPFFLQLAALPRVTWQVQPGGVAAWRPHHKRCLIACQRSSPT